MFNTVIMLGRIARDLEPKTTPAGVSVLTFSIAVDRRYQADKESRVSDFFRADRLTHIRAVQEHVLRALKIADVDLRAFTDFRNLRFIVQVCAVIQTAKPDRPVHGSGIDIHKAQFF